MSDLPIIASAFVSGFVAPSVVAWYALTSQRREQERLARTELRAVLDEAARALGESRRAIDTVADQWKRGELPTNEEVKEAALRHRTASVAAQDAKDRIAIRLGRTDSAAASFQAAAAALDGYSSLLAPYLRGSDEDIDGTALNAARSSFVKALDDYYAAARGVSTDSGGRAQRIVGSVTLILIVVGAALIGAAYKASRDGDRLRVNGSEVQVAVSRLFVPGAGQTHCVPRQADGMGTWRCTQLGRASGRSISATVLSDGRVFVQSGAGVPRATCCVTIR